VAQCNTVQGFYFSRPLPVGDFVELLRANKGRFQVPEVVGLKVVK
jgi:EAL domain-containing protein (putative c-di-GMP-specific phosphodiesterase class I)